LIEKCEANYKVINNKGENAFYLACGSGNLELIEYFFDKNYIPEDALNTIN